MVEHNLRHGMMWAGGILGYGGYLPSFQGFFSDPMLLFFKLTALLVFEMREAICR